jgi:S1-C subfamily serine protease/regulation of enolase protein 1 (concanavalin A-like superfamily)
MNGRTVACPGCRHQFRAGGAPAQAKTQAKRVPSLIDDDDDGGQPESTLPTSRGRSTGRVGIETTAPSGTSPAVIAAIAIGGVCVLLLVVLIVLLAGRGGGNPPTAPANHELVSHVAPEPDIPTRPQPQVTPASNPSVEDETALVNRVKDATIFIKLQVDGKTLGSGTGFVIRMAGDAALIATNRHVIAPDVDDPKKLQVVAVFRSGEPGEQELPAQIVAADFSGEMSYDLALIQVKGVTRPVQPIVPEQAATPRVTMKYSAYGFPLSNMTNFNKGNPTITVTSGQVSGLRNDDAGQLSAIQLDGSVQPGNSGGPIVDNQGKLIGVAVAKLSVVDTIGLAVPAIHLREFLAGRIGAMDFVLKNSQSANPDLEIKAQVLDPDQHIKGVKILVAPLEGTPPIARQQDGSWPPLPKAETADMQVYRGVARGTVKVSFSPQAQGANARKILIQTAHTDASGKTVYSVPKAVDLPAKDGRMVAEGRFDELKRKLARKSLAKLGPLVEDDDPKTADECKVDKDMEKYKVMLTVPGGKPFTLSPSITTKEKKPKALHNAPRVLADVEGDFVTLVQVGGDINPGIDPIKDPKGKSLNITFQGAGLIVYQDKDNFLRMERACRAQGMDQHRELLVEAVHNGRVIPGGYYYIELPGDPRAPIDLILVRQGDRIKMLFSFDQKTLFGFHDFTLDFPSKVKVGLTATNLSKKAFTAHFEDFLLSTDKSILGDDLGE